MSGIIDGKITANALSSLEGFDEVRVNWLNALKPLVFMPVAPPDRESSRIALVVPISGKAV
ncbi:hypothetical protein D3C71_2126860 [compost metagenome]